MPAMGIKDPGDPRGAVGARQAQPADRAGRVDEARRVAVGQQAIVGDRTKPLVRVDRLRLWARVGHRHLWLQSGGAGMGIRTPAPESVTPTALDCALPGNRPVGHRDRWQPQSQERPRRRFWQRRSCTYRRSGPGTYTAANSSERWSQAPRLESPWSPRLRAPARRAF